MPRCVKNLEENTKDSPPEGCPKRRSFTGNISLGHTNAFRNVDSSGLAHCDVKKASPAGNLNRMLPVLVMSAVQNFVTFPDGSRMPVIGLGTWQVIFNP